MIKYSGNTVNEIDYNESPVKEIYYNSSVAYIRKTRTNSYRWVNDGTLCDGYDEYEKLIEQVSYDGGESWQNVVPEVSMKGELIEYQSRDCGYNSSFKSLEFYISGLTPTTVGCQTTVSPAFEKISKVRINLEYKTSNNSCNSIAFNDGTIISDNGNITYLGQTNTIESLADDDTVTAITWINNKTIEFVPQSSLTMQYFETSFVQDYISLIAGEKTSDFVISDFGEPLTSKTDITEGYYIIYSAHYQNTYANKAYLMSWNSGNTWNGYYTLGNMNHTDSQTSVPISDDEIIDDAVWKFTSDGNGNFYIQNVATGKYWFYIGRNSNYGTPLTDNEAEAIPVNVTDYFTVGSYSGFGLRETYTGSYYAINRLYNNPYRYGWWNTDYQAADGNNVYMLRKLSL